MFSRINATAYGIIARVEAPDHPCWLAYKLDGVWHLADSDTDDDVPTVFENDDIASVTLITRELFEKRLRRLRAAANDDARQAAEDAETMRELDWRPVTPTSRPI